MRAVLARRAGGVDIAIVAFAAVLLADCRLAREVRPESASDLRVEAIVSRDGFEWASQEDQLACARARAYPAKVASVLHDALAEGCTPCRKRSLSFRLFLLNEPVAQRAEVVSLVLLDLEPRESARTLAELSGVLSQTRLPPVPVRGSRCALEVMTTPLR